VNVELSKQAEELVSKKVACGDYASPDAVVDAALQRMLDDEAAYWAEVRRMVDEALVSVREGRVTSYSPDLAEKIIASARARRNRSSIPS
jgi:putative addiction module CopG family antidote